jgi:general secretion pathway protein G
MRARARLRGFTLIELLVSVAIVAVLATMAMPLAELKYQRDKERDLKTALREIRGALDAYKAAADEGRVGKSQEQSGYPPSLSVLVEGAPDIRSAGGNRMYFLRRLPRDPFAEADLPAEATWGKRAYESPPDKPREGKDVFDVYSRSERVGLNGIPLREW